MTFNPDDHDLDAAIRETLMLSVPGLTRSPQATTARSGGTVLATPPPSALGRAYALLDSGQASWKGVVFPLQPSVIGKIKRLLAEACIEYISSEDEPNAPVQAVSEVPQRKVEDVLEVPEDEEEIERQMGEGGEMSALRPISVEGLAALRKMSSKKNRVPDEGDET